MGVGREPRDRAALPPRRPRRRRFAGDGRRALRDRPGADPAGDVGRHGRRRHVAAGARDPQAAAATRRCRHRGRGDQPRRRLQHEQRGRQRGRACPPGARPPAPAGGAQRLAGRGVVVQPGDGGDSARSRSRCARCAPARARGHDPGLRTERPPGREHDLGDGRGVGRAPRHRARARPQRAGARHARSFRDAGRRAARRDPVPHRRREQRSR